MLLAISPARWTDPQAAAAEAWALRDAGVHGLLLRLPPEADLQPWLHLLVPIWAGDLWLHLRVVGALAATQQYGLNLHLPGGVDAAALRPLAPRGLSQSVHDRAGLQPELMAGTSIGALMSMFRARFKVFDGAALIAAARRLSWSSVFRVLEMESRYGIPASLRLYLRAALGTLFEVDGKRQMTFRDVEIPLLVVTTGITVDALKHDLSYYEHFLDDVERPGAVFRRGRLRRLAKLGEVLREFMSRPESLREIVFGADPHTMDADILDAAGFSAAVPGVIHYDVVRDDQRMKQLLDTLYAEYGITRLTEGGLVNNLPARPAWLEATHGRLKRRNPFVLAMDCFAPSRRSLQWLPIQQIVRPNVKANLEYSDFYFALDRRLSPVNLVPDVAAVSEAMQWTTDELAPDLPFIQESCRHIAVLPEA